MDVKWTGRIRVNERGITPEQYKMFFGRWKFGISFNMVNLLLEDNANGMMTECVPADELNDEATAAIKDQVLHMNKMEGTINLGGEELRWAWDFAEFTDDRTGDPIERKDIPEWQMEKILDTMLNDQCHWGIVEG